MILLNGQKVEFKKFPNGETNFDYSTVINATAFLSQRVELKYESDLDLFNLMLLKKYLDTVNARVKLVLYYMPYSRMDRSDNGSPFTLQYVTDFIKSLKFDHITVVEPHSDVTPALLGNHVKVVHMSEKILELVKQDIRFCDDIDYIVYPDAGAQKRYSKSNPKNQLVGHKKRDFATGKIDRLEIVGDILATVSKARAIIVDDLSSYGTTFIKTADKLRELGIKEVYLVVAHAENSIFDPHPVTNRELLKELDRVYTTDSILSKHGTWANVQYDEAHQNKLKVYDIKELLSND